jgi:2-iminobutanoate/2-iminopropanoate deaminase
MIGYPKSSDTPVSHLPFSPASRVGELIFVSGQASVDTTGKIISDTFEGEMRRSIENLRQSPTGCGQRPRPCGADPQLRA